MNDVPYIAPFPPNFDGNPWTYGLALFSDVLVSALCLAQLLVLLMEGRRKREIHAVVTMRKFAIDTFPQFSPMQVRRWILVCFLLTILARAFPDSVWMFLWGEASKPTMEFWFLVDWWGDILALIPCLVCLALIAWSGQAIDQALSWVSGVPLAKPKWEQIKQPVYIVALVLMLAVGVTIGKAHA